MKIKILNLIRKICVFFLKRDYINKITKYGKCEITDDKIICIVEEEKLVKYCNKYLYFDLNITDFFEKDKKILEICGLDKPIQYIIQGIKFKEKLYINVYGNNEIIFKECTFSDHININHVNNITFDNNKYIPKYIPKQKTAFWLSIRRIEDAKTIKIINNGLNCELKKDEVRNIGTNSVFNTHLSADKVEIINCQNIICDILRIDTKNLYIENSKIESNESYITADNIDIENSKIDIKNGIVIENINCNDKAIKKIESLYILYNDEEICDEDNIIVKKETLHQKRLKLLEVLYKIKNNCEDIILYKLIKVSNTMGKELVTKILKK